MNTATISAEIKTSDIPLLEALLKKFKAKSIKIEMPKDDAKMTKEEYFEMIDKASKGKKYDMSFDELMQKTLSYGE